MIFVALVIAVCAVVGFLFGEDPESAKPSKEMANDPVVQSYVRALEVVEENHVSPPDKFRMARGAILGMLHSLDPHSGQVFMGISLFFLPIFIGGQDRICVFQALLIQEQAHHLGHA